MKRLVSIFFLVIFLFNVGGYYIVFWGMEHLAKKNLLTRLDANDYSDSEVVVLTIPLSLPYPLQQNGYERVDGEFQHNGEHFKLVKQKVENDTLFIVCVRDRETTRIAHVLADYSKVANNVPAGSKQALNFLSKIYKDFNTTEFTKIYKSRYLFERTFYAHNTPSVLNESHLVESPPPELLF